VGGTNFIKYGRQDRGKGKGQSDGVFQNKGAAIGGGKRDKVGIRVSGRKAPTTSHKVQRERKRLEGKLPGGKKKKGAAPGGTRKKKQKKGGLHPQTDEGHDVKKPGGKGGPREGEGGGKRTRGWIKKKKTSKNTVGHTMVGGGGQCKKDPGGVTKRAKPVGTWSDSKGAEAPPRQKETGGRM